MKKIVNIALLSLAIVATSCKGDKKAETDEVTVEETAIDAADVVEVKKLTMKLMPKSDSKAEGSVVFQEEDGLVTMTAVIGGLTEGMHAIHIHENADCSAADGTSAGGHWNPTFEDHGRWGSTDGYHKGDIGNFPVDNNGNGTVTFSTDEWCIGCDDAKKDITGKAIIVHRDADDYVSQPSGAAGARVSCGGIIE